MMYNVFTILLGTATYIGVLTLVSGDIYLFTAQNITYLATCIVRQSLIQVPLHLETIKAELIHFPYSNCYIRV